MIGWVPHVSTTSTGLQRSQNVVATLRLQKMLSNCPLVLKFVVEMTFSKKDTLTTVVKCCSSGIVCSRNGVPPDINIIDSNRDTEARAKLLCGACIKSLKTSTMKIMLHILFWEAEFSEIGV